MRTGKTKEVKILQGNYGYGWEDICKYEKENYSESSDDLKAYRENAPECVYRIITRRVQRGIISKRKE